MSETNADNFSDNSQANSTQLYEIIEAFEDAWQSGQIPAIEQFLPAAAKLRQDVLGRILHIDLENRLNTGEAIRVETYVSRFPDLAENRAVLLDLITWEFTLRRRTETDLTLDEYARRFPALADELTKRLTTAPETLPAATAPAAVPAVAGYEILGELGRGGMGVVYKARQVRADRLVALKIILAGGHAGADALARFRTETHAVARLQHPSIVQIHEVGEHDGLPFFSLEFCEGGSLASKLDGTPWPPEQAAKLVETLARAMHAAHEQKIIHRDLKPGNVLLAANGEPKIADFGLAKKLDDEGQTATQAIMGTPSYMAPEQAEGKSKEVASTADVYSLGAILYELLTGRPPFKGTTPRETVLQVLANDPVPPRQLQPKTPRDVETICLKCLQKEPHKRYAAGAELAEDLRRFRNGEPILARPAGRIEKVAKWARRNRAVASLLVLIAFLTVTGLWAILHQLARAERALADLEAEKETLKTEKKTAEDNWTRSEWKAYTANIGLAGTALQDDDYVLARHYLTRCRWDFRGWEHAYLWTSLNRTRVVFKDGMELYAHPPTLRGHTGEVLSVAFSPDGKQVVSGGNDNTLKVWDVSTGQQMLALNGHLGPVNSVTFSSDGKRILSASDDMTIMMWDAATGEKLLTFKGHIRGIIRAVISPDGKWAASTSGKWSKEDGYVGELKIWDIASGKNTLTRRYPLNSGDLSISRDSRRIIADSNVWDVSSGQKLCAIVGRNASFGPDGNVKTFDGKDIRVWDSSNGTTLKTVVLTEEEHLGHLSASGTFSRDGQLLVTRLHGGVGLQVWNTANGQLTYTLRGHTQLVTSMAFSPDGHYIACGCRDKVVRLWNISGRRDYDTEALVFSPDGKHFAVPGENGTVEIWNASNNRRLHRMAGHTNFAAAVAFSVDGKRIASGSHDKTVKVWNVSTGQELFTLKGHTGSVRALAFSADGSRLATGSDGDETVKVWDLNERKDTLTVKGHKVSTQTVAFSPDGRRIVSIGHATPYNEARVWDAMTRADMLSSAFSSSAFPNHVTSADFSSDGKYLVGGGFGHAIGNGEICVLESSGGKELVRLKVGAGPVTRFVFSPGCDRLLVCGGKQVPSPGRVPGYLGVWDVLSGKELLSFTGHLDIVTAACFSPDGRRIASVSEDKTVRMWDAVSGEEVLTMKRRFAGHSIAFSPDGKRLITKGGPTDIWDASEPDESRTIIWDKYSVTSVTFNPDGRRIIASGKTTGGAGVVRIWDAASGQDVGILASYTGDATGVSFSHDGKRFVSPDAESGKMKVWDASNGQAMFVLDGPVDGPYGVPEDVAFSADDKRIVACRSIALTLSDPLTGREVLTHRFFGQGDFVPQGISCVTFSPDGKQIVIGGGEVGKPGLLSVFDVSRRRVLLPIKGHEGFVTSVVFSPDGTRIVSGSADKSIRIWNASDGQPISTLKGHTGTVTRLVCSPDGKYIVSGSEDATVKVWDAASGREIRTFNGSGAVTGLACSPDGKRIASGSEGRLHVWQMPQ